MKHIIIGAGTIGAATGIWLKANNEEVMFNDINSEALNKLEQKGFKVSMFKKDIALYMPDIIWVCTAEWDTEKVLKDIYELNSHKIIVIRSTMPVGETEKLTKKYGLRHVAHVPEFLRQKTAIEDIFNKDRIIIGTEDRLVQLKLEEIFKSVTVPVFITDIKTSELIKYASNCWLASQISFWNEIKKLCDKLCINPQAVANGATLDKRISKYGSAMTGEPWGGFCYPKDIKSLIKSFEEKDIDPIFLKAVKKVNDENRDGKKKN